jgi:hypothetical protein
MKVHGNAALGPAGRLALVEAIESAPATAHRWWHRWREAGDEDRRCGGWLQDRSSRPHRQPRRLTAAEEEPILRARRQTNLGPGRLAGICRRARSTIWKVLHRHGLSQRRSGARESYRRYEWSEPGALLHVDVARLARFNRPGHAVTGVRDMTGAEKRAGVGYAYLHPASSSPSTAPATSSPRPTRRAGTGRWSASSTLKREWAYAHSWPNSAERARAMASFLRYCNRRRPHSSLGDRPPISRIHNVRGQDS